MNKLTKVKTITGYNSNQLCTLKLWEYLLPWRNMVRGHLNMYLKFPNISSGSNFTIYKPTFLATFKRKSGLLFQYLSWHLRSCSRGEVVNSNFIHFHGFPIKQTFLCKYVPSEHIPFNSYSMLKKHVVWKVTSLPNHSPASSNSTLFYFLFSKACYEKVESQKCHEAGRPPKRQLMEGRR